MIKEPSAHAWCEVRGPEDNGRGKLIGFDEIVASGVDVHIERMHDGDYFMTLTKGDQTQRVEFWCKGKLRSGTEVWP